MTNFFNFIKNLVIVHSYLEIQIYFNPIVIYRVSGFWGDIISHKIIIISILPFTFLVYLKHFLISIISFLNLNYKLFILFFVII